MEVLIRDGIRLVNKEMEDNLMVNMPFECAFYSNFCTILFILSLFNRPPNSSIT